MYSVSDKKNWLIIELVDQNISYFTTSPCNLVIFKGKILFSLPVPMSNVIKVTNNFTKYVIHQSFFLFNFLIRHSFHFFYCVMIFGLLLVAFTVTNSCIPRIWVTSLTIARVAVPVITMNGTPCIRKARTLFSSPYSVRISFTLVLQRVSVRKQWIRGLNRNYYNITWLRRQVITKSSYLKWHII